jgi:hypothetical protein
MPVADVEPDSAWDCSWEATRKRQLVAAANATPAQRLEWLEEAIALAHGSGALPRGSAEPASAGA